MLAGQTSAAQMFIANGTTSIASILSSGKLAAGDLILVTATTTDTGTLTLGAADSGITIAGLDGVSVTPGFTINGATGLTIRNLIVQGAVSITNTANVTLAENTLGSVTLNGATNLLMRDNQIGSLTIAGASQGSIHDNSIAGATNGLVINAAFTGLIFNNEHHRERNGRRLCRRRGAVEQSHLWRGDWRLDQYLQPGDACSARSRARRRTSSPATPSAFR